MGESGKSFANRYAQGRALEYKVRNALVKNGYYVIRSAGSKGAVDLLAMKFHEILMVQVKKDGSLPTTEWNRLYFLARQLDAIPILARDSDKRGGSVRFFRLIEEKKERGKLPMRTYSLTVAEQVVDLDDLEDEEED